MEDTGFARFPGRTLFSIAGTCHGSLAGALPPWELGRTKPHLRQATEDLFTLGTADGALEFVVLMPRTGDWPPASIEFMLIRCIHDFLCCLLDLKIASKKDAVTLCPLEQVEI